MKWLLICVVVTMGTTWAWAEPQTDVDMLQVDPVAVIEGIQMVQDALTIARNAKTRADKHAAELASRGLAEVPASREAVRYTIDTHGLGDLLFDDWGEFYIDRRFLTADEMKRVKEIEDFVWKHVIVPLRGAKVLPIAGSRQPPSAKTPVKRTARVRAGGKGLPVFRGFEDARYQEHDALIARLTADFNANKAKWCGGTDTDRYYSEEYADKIVRRAENPDLFVPIEIKLAK